MELIIGNILVRPNLMKTPGARTPRHPHNFDHATFARMGWFLIRKETPAGVESVVQIGSPEYGWLRSLLTKYEPHKVPRPVRFPDILDATGRKMFDVRFIPQGAPVPEGGEEILWSDDLRWFELIKAEDQHEIVCLSDSGVFDCTYSHRDPQGNIVLEYQDWTPSYE